MKETTPNNKPRIALIGTDWGVNPYRKKHNKPGAISQYRLINPMKALEKFYDFTYWGSDFPERSEEAESHEQFFEDFMQDYDLVISKIIDNDKAAAMMRFFSERNGTKLVVDIDDNIWELTPDQPGYKEYHKGAPRLVIASTFVSLADAVFCSTQPLASYIENRIRKIFKEEKDTYVLPNCIDPLEFQFEKKKRNDGKIVIGWQGSTTHHHDLRVAVEGIRKVLEKYPDVYFEFLGGMTKEMAMDLFKGMKEKDTERLSIHGGCDAWEQFPKLLSEQKWDIAIAPLENKLFNHSKSHIKWMEYAMVGIPCVASTVYPYMEPIQNFDTIVEGETGLLASEDEWFDKLSLLIDNEAERTRIAGNAKEYVTNMWNIHAHADKWRNAIDKVLKKEE